MNNMKKILNTVATFAIIVAAVFGMNGRLLTKAEGTTYSVKAYTPDKYDFVDFYGGVGDINPEDGDGITTFAHAGLITPLEGANIQFNTSFKLLSKKAAEEGGSGIDGWATYSFAKTPADKDAGDSTVPSYANGTDGVFFHITNYSGTTAPNCVEVQIVERLNGKTTTISNGFVDNICDIRMSFSLKQNDDGTYTWTAKKMGTDEVIKSIENLALNQEAFVNANGQTYFSTAIYEGAGCDGNHWEHRGVSVYSVSAYSADIAADCVSLSASEYTFEEGNSYSPEVTVTLGETTLVNGEDYEVTYNNNNAVGTATAKVIFYGVYGGNVIEKTYEIKEAPAAPVEPDTSVDSGEPVEPTDPVQSEEQSDDGCGSSMSVSCVWMLVALTAVASTMFILKRKEQ